METDHRVRSLYAATPGGHGGLDAERIDRKGSLGLVSISVSDLAQQLHVLEMLLFEKVRPSGVDVAQSAAEIKPVVGQIRI